MSEDKKEPVAEPKVVKFLSMDDISAAKDIRYAEVEIPEWGGTVRIGSLTAADMIDWTEANEGPAKRTAGLRILVKSLVDGEGKRIGTEKHLEIFRHRDAGVCARLVQEVIKLNGLAQKARDEQKNVSSEAITDVSPTVLH